MARTTTPLIGLVGPVDDPGANPLCDAIFEAMPHLYKTPITERLRSSRLTRPC